MVTRVSNGIMITDRYRRQILVKEVGQNGQELLATKHVTLIGGGGLGSHSADLLVRFGIGRVDIIDYDIVDITNLHRSAVFSEEDVGKSKALILQKRLQPVNTWVQVNGINRKVTRENILSLVRDADVILDGTDNLPLRFLMNDTAIDHCIPWVYAGVYEMMGMVMGILPHKTACFRCIAQDFLQSGAQEIPVLGSLPATIAAIQCNEAIKLLLGQQPTGLLIYDVWNQCFDVVNINRNPCCPTCKTKK